MILEINYEDYERFPVGRKTLNGVIGICAHCGRRGEIRDVAGKPHWSSDVRQLVAHRKVFSGFVWDTVDCCIVTEEDLATRT